MTTDETTNGNGHGSGGDDLDLARDLDDWVFAGRGVFRVVERLGGLVPPFGSDRAAELAQLIAAADGEFARLVSVWKTVIRPALTRHEDHAAPGWVAAGTGDPRYSPGETITPDPVNYSDGYWIDHWKGGAQHLIAVVDALRECIPPADDGVAWSISTFHLPRVDDQFARVVRSFDKAVRPRLMKYARRRPR